MRPPGMVLAVTIVSAAACVPTTPPSPPPPPARLSLDYTPTAPCTTPGGVRTTLAVVSPQWKEVAATTGAPGAYAAAAAATGGLGSSSFREELISALRVDFFELMTCRGLLTKGPFESFEQMVYPDREGSNLLLEPELELRLDIARIAPIPVQSWLGGALTNSAAGYRLRGEATLSGRVTLVLKEPLSNTRMWTRSMEVPATSANFQTDQAYQVTAAHSEMLLRMTALQDVGVVRALTPQLSAIYTDILTTADKHLNVRELAMVAAQAAEVRKKAVIAVPR